jgi:5-methylcytosine-specific restriction endonuclease McrA
LAKWEGAVAIKTEQERIRVLYSSKKSAVKKAAEKKNTKEDFSEGFSDANFFVCWWGDQLKKQCNKCAYCGTSADLIAALIVAGALRTRQGRGEGRRGKCLELERKDPRGPYNPDNCVLVCMYCNNDKSDIYEHGDYLTYFGPARKKHFESLAARWNVAGIVADDK